jgi:hypothetical protein
MIYIVLNNSSTLYMETLDNLKVRESPFLHVCDLLLKNYQMQLKGKH